jgi:Spherulation-specific family 4
VFRSKRHRQATRVASAVLAGLGALATGVYGNASQAASSVKIGVPAYFWPGGYWDRVVAGSADVSLAVVNIATGPGAAKNTAFVTQFAAARNAGIKLVGYVDTTYGARSAASVKTDIANYKSWYGITSIFFDETPWSCDNTAYYADLSAVVHANGGTNIMNPGGSSLSCWGPIGDMIVNFEGSGATYDSWVPDEWTNQYPASKFWHIVYGTLGPQVAETVSKTKARNAATVFITDDIMPNPFDRMPDPTVWAPTLKAIGPVAVAVTTVTTPGATPAATAVPVAATVPAPVITFEAIATTTTEPPTTTVAPTAAPTVPPTVATTVAPTSPPATAAPATSPKATVAPAVTAKAASPAVTAAPAKAATPTPAAPAPAPAAPSPAAPVATPAPNNPATVFGAAPTGGGVEIVNASDPAKPDSAAPDSAKTDAAKSEPVKAEPVKSEAPAAGSPAGSGSTSATVSGATKAAAPSTTLPNSLALKTPETGKSKKPVVKAKPAKKPAKAPAKPVAKAPSKIIAKAGPKIPIAKAPATNVAAKPVAARPIAAASNR